MRIKTIRKNFQSCAKKEIEKAKLSHTVQSMIEHPLNKHYKQIVSQKDLNNCLIDVGDVKNSKVIFGHHQPGLEG